MSHAEERQRFDVAAFIDERSIGWREITLLVICSLILFIDGFDMYFLGKIAPAVARGLGEEPSGMTKVFVWQQVGMAVGAFGMPPVADRIGRKPVLILSMLSFGLLSFWAGHSQSLAQMAVLRGLSGIFFAAMLPVGLALLSEMTPRRVRSSFIAIALVCLSGGNIASGVVAAWLLDIYGWQIGFWLGAALPLAALPLLLLVPESLAFRVGRNPRDARLRSQIGKMEPSITLPDAPQFHYGQEDDGEGKRLGPSAMFARRYRLQTVVLWAACFLSLGNIALLANWLSTYFQELGGVPIQQFAKWLMIGFLGGAVGTLSMGWFMARSNPYWLICGFFLLDAVALTALGFVPFGTALFVGALIAWNFCQVGGQAGLNTLATLGYPPEMRSSGMGWATGVGRIGGIVFPLLGGMALDTTLGMQAIMMLIAAPALVIAFLVLLLGLGSRQQQESPGAV